MPTSITAHTFFFNYSRAMEDDEIFHSIIASSPEDDDLFPRTVEDIFNDFTGRRSGFLRALTADVDRFYSLCGSEMEILCLYAYPDGTWEVNNPPEVLPLSLLQPVIGINFARDSMPRVDWLDFIAVHSDCWLFALSSYFSASARLSRDERNRLFDLINELPTLAEIMSSSAYSPTLFKMMTSSAYYGVKHGSRKQIQKRHKMNSLLLEFVVVQIYEFAQKNSYSYI